MMTRTLSLLAFAALPLAAQHSDEDLAFSAAVKEFLPAPATAMPVKKTELTFTPDPPRAADSSPEAHPEAYNRFADALRKISQENTYNFCQPLRIILETTGDEFAVMKWMEKAVRDEIPAACQYVGDRRLMRVSQDKVQSPEIKQAYQLVRKAADAGYDAAKINVCMCMQQGIGTEKNEEEAQKYIFEACRSGNIIPRHKWLQMTGRLSSWDDRERPEVAAEIERGNHHVMFYLSGKAPTLPEKIELLRKAAEKGNPEALYALSALSSESAPRESLILLKEAVAQQSADALYALGLAMTEGDPANPLFQAAGMEHNDLVGRAFIRLSSMMNHVGASFWLGASSYHGRCGMTVDKERAFRFFDHGAMQGNATCGTAAGIMMLRGLGIPQDARKGLFYLNVAANSGVPHAVIMLAYAQHSGIGVPADSDAAIKLLQEVAAMGQKQAYIYMAYIAAKGGNKFPADPATAERYLRYAKLDLKDDAQKMYDKLMEEGWNPEP